MQASGCFSKLLFCDVLCPDFCIRLSDYFTGVEPDWDEDGRDRPVLVFQFVLQGTLHYKLENESKAADKQQLKEGEYNLFSFPSLRAVNWIDPANSGTITLDIHLSPCYLQKLTTGYPELARVLARRRLGFTGQMGTQHAQVHPDLMRSIMDIINCAFTGDLRRIYLQSKVSELLLQALDRIAAAPAEKGKHIVLSREDVEKLQATQDYLQQHMENPPTLKELSQKMGINDYKLKKGYKQLFGMTIHKDFHRIRMDKAMQDLLESRKTILEIALQYGYQDSSNFSSAFKRHFGITPGELQKRREPRQK